MRISAASKSYNLWMVKYFYFMQLVIYYACTYINVAKLSWVFFKELIGYHMQNLYTQMWQHNHLGQTTIFK